MAKPKERRRTARSHDPGGDDRPIRRELFGEDRLRQHALTLAQTQHTAPAGPRPALLAGRTRENQTVLLAAYQSIVRRVDQHRAITPAAEWLLDNFHVIEEQVKDVAEALPGHRVRELPALAGGVFLAGYPRAYGIAWALVAHTDSRFAPDTLGLFIRAYQEVQPLTLDELWALPALLRVLLLENLRRFAVLVMRSQTGRGLADEFVDQVERAALQPDPPAPPPGVLPPPPLRQAFAVQIAQRLHDPHPDTPVSLDFLDRWLAEEGTDLDEVVRREHADQVAANWTVRNIITSLRAVAAFDWPPFVEALSLVEACLRGHPGYGAMDFLTRDRYRRAIGQIARRSPYSELDIAREVVAHAGRAADDPRRGDPGYYLIGAGRAGFERGMGFRPGLKQRLLRAYVAHALAAYLGSLGAVALLALAGVLWAGMEAGLGGAGLAWIGLLALFPATDIAAALVNRLALALLPARHLPRLELKQGIPAELRTFVVVPTVLDSSAGIRGRIGQLEVRYLANPEGEVYYALLSDWAGAERESLPGDAALLRAAREGVAALNAKHGGGRFFLFHRRRAWDAAAGCWTGWEGRRGQLREFNRLLRGATDTRFLPPAADAPAPPQNVRYVVHLEADTRLPMDSVSWLVGTAAHPLNRPALDPATRRVVEGYALLQPRLTPTLPLRRERSLYQRIVSCRCGIEDYSSALSEVYQDWFGFGTPLGKGLYEIDAYEAALAGRWPEPDAPGQDVLESVYARCALVADVEFFEAAQAHAGDGRGWRRGDGRLWRWVFGAGGRDLPWSGRWRLLDRLRRSLSMPMAFLVLVAAWAVPGAPMAALVSLVALALAGPALLAFLAALVPPRRGFVLADHLREAGETLGSGLGAALLDGGLLAQRAGLLFDTALPASSDGRGFRLNPTPLGPSARWAVVAAVLVLWFNPGRIGVAAPFLLLWGLAPLWMRALAAPFPAQPPDAPQPDDMARFRWIGRRTWRFFTAFVDAGDHHLPPDNFQEDPKPVVAHRSSPTNFGLYLLSVLAARDFGWLGLGDALDRLEATFHTFDALPRWRGHFFNWYDTSDLRPLEPRYLSTVDSGNLAGHLLVLAQSCREQARQPLAVSAALRGMADTHALLCAALAGAGAVPEALCAQAALIGQGLADAPADPGGWEPLWARSLACADELCALAQGYAGAAPADPARAEVAAWAGLLRDDLRSHARDWTALDPARAGHVPLGEAGEAGAALAARLDALADRAERLFREMDFGFLYDPARHLFSLGYLVNEGRLDGTYYDLLASEARLASQIAIAKREAPSTHWARLGRRMTRVAAGHVLLSWSGSMFEYLMPSLVGFTPRHSLLDETCRRVVARQIEYGRQRGIPWGISESAFAARDAGMTYQYSAFGVPGLGMKRGLARDWVVAPYATALAALYRPQAAAENYARLEALGGLGRYGFYEALDFTPERLAERQGVAVVRCYMAHHQGMALVALADVVHDGAMRGRFHRVPLIQATELLLHERGPRGLDTHSPRSALDQAEAAQVAQPPVRQRPSPTSALPSSHLLSNGRYAVMLTAAGSGYSAWNELAVTRWREDPVRDDWGAFFYLRNRATGRVWSAGYQPTAAVPDHYAVDFLEDRARIARADGDIATTLEIVVSPEDDAEIRRLSLANHGPAPVEIELTSYAEIVLAPPAADAAHPVFSNLFVDTGYLPQAVALWARRRPRGAGEPERWAGQVLAGVAADAGVEYETDRMRCLGRGRGVRSPLALQDGGPLGNSVGPVLDPVFCFRVRLRIEPGAVAHTVFTTFVAQNRDDLQELALKYRDPALFDRVSALAWTQAQVQLRHLRIAADEAQLFQALANRLLYADAALRPSGAVLALNTLGQRALWRHGISGDRPMVLARIGDAGQRALAEQLLRAQEYWRAKRLAVDLVFLCEQDASYAEELGGLLESLVRAQRALSGAGPDPVRGAVAVVRADWLDEADRLLLRSSARVVLAGWRGTLAEQLLRRARGPSGYAPLRRPWTGAGPADLDALAGPDPSTLEFFNGLGGFTDGGRDYVVRLGPGQSTPLPWTNVIANPDFGFLVTESGGGYTWSLNSRENPLTPWSNDPVGDPPGEAFYLRDEDSGELWCPTALPIRVEGGHYLIRHGQGYSRFDHASHGIHSALTQCVDPADPVKVSILRLRDTSGRPRRLSVVAYAEWALGNSRPAAAPYVVTESDPATGALLARNPWSAEFGGRVAFADLGGRPTAWTASREEFLGRNGGLDAPAGLLGRRAGLRRRCGAGLDPCAALQTGIELGPGGTAEVVFLLGQGADRAGALDLIRRHRAIPAAETLERARRAWDERLGALQIQTPDRGLDLLVNRWLVYQALGCRVWARAAFYQAGGAYGFRDQLQDGMALAAADPAGVRAHLLRAAGRQFPEGDVQHWWHPPTGRGVRTHCSDDRLWLPVAVVRYLDVSGDAAVLDEEIPFIDGPPLPPGREDAYFEPTLSEIRASLYEHCARALDVSLALGPHSLPLIGAGDWNDGMNRVGQAGRGESVWLAWFLISALEAFIPLAAARDDAGRADRWRGHAERLKAAAEAAAWDGAWYRRAWFDDGTPLGSAANAECRIDSLPQSWAALSGAADPERARRALDAVWERLVRGGDSLVLLFDPPFRRGADPDSHATPDPGYIAGYPPGTRENGGQYTHAAVWCALAETRLDNGSGAVELLRMLNPVYRGADKAGREAYRGEPYVLAADVHAGPEHARRAGWTWYTGAAGWYYRTAVEGVLGLELRAGTLFVDPCPPTAWPGFAASLRRGSARYGIAVENPQGVRRGVAALELDGEALPPQGGIPLADDGREHRVRVVMG